MGLTFEVSCPYFYFCVQQQSLIWSKHDKSIGARPKSLSPLAEFVVLHTLYQSVLSTTMLHVYFPANTDLAILTYWRVCINMYFELSCHELLFFVEFFLAKELNVKNIVNVLQEAKFGLQLIDHFHFKADHNQAKLKLSSA